MVIITAIALYYLFNGCINKKTTEHFQGNNDNNCEFGFEFWENYCKNTYSQHQPCYHKCSCCPENMQCATATSGNGSTIVPGYSYCMTDADLTMFAPN